MPVLTDRALERLAAARAVRDAVQGRDPAALRALRDAGLRAATVTPAPIPPNAMGDV